MKMLVRTMLLMLLCGGGLAQQVSPVVVQYVRAGEGSFEVSNPSDRSLVVIVEPKSFSIDETGKGFFRKLDAGIHVSLSETSFKLAARQKRTIFYKAQADVYPAWMCLYSRFIGLPGRNGMAVELELPHTVYLLQKEKAANADVEFGELRLKDGEVTGHLVNRSAKVLRVEALEVSQVGGKAKGSDGGFPLLPHATREFSVSVKAQDGARLRLVAHFGGTKVEAEFGGRAAERSDGVE
jgi:hypothetical protein